MWMDADSDEEGCGDDYDASDDRAYWRRRFLILCGGVVALGACAWLFPGAHQSSAHDAAATRASVAALGKRQALPSVAYGSTWPEPSKAAPSPAASAKLDNEVKKAKKEVKKAKKKKMSTAYRPRPIPLILERRP